MNRSDIEFDGCEAFVSLINLCSPVRYRLLLPPLICTWIAMLSAGSSLLEVVEVTEPDLERFILTIIWVQSQEKTS